jgi:hypothetical protein
VYFVVFIAFFVRRSPTKSTICKPVVPEFAPPSLAVLSPSKPSEPEISTLVGARTAKAIELYLE